MQAENSIQEFKPNKEYPIGGFFKIGKEVFKVVNSTGALCSECDIVTENNGCARQRCLADERSDHVEVGFILYDELED